MGAAVGRSGGAIGGVCIDERHRRLENPGLEELLEIIDETDGGAGAARAQAEGLLASILIHSPS